MDLGESAVRRDAATVDQPNAIIGPLYTYSAIDWLPRTMSTDIVS